MGAGRAIGALAGALGTLALAGCSVFGSSAAPEPPYRLEVRDGDFEIRHYPPLTVAMTRAEGSWNDAVGTGFGRLFDYISGANEGARDIAMTAPVVTEQAAGRKIAMTAPVLTETEGAGDGGWRTMFVLPQDLTEATAPRPTDPAVRLGTLPARRVAVVRFSGLLRGARFEEQKARLADWLAARDETPAANWQMAGYNPPWTLPPLRRNEVLVTLTDAGG